MVIGAFRCSWLQAPDFSFNGLRRGYDSMLCCCGPNCLHFGLGAGGEVVVGGGWLRISMLIEFSPLR
jgi:hypothetical protein